MLRGTFLGFTPLAHVLPLESGEFKVPTSTVAALFSKMALTGQIIAMVDMALLVFYSIFISTVGVDGARVCL